MAGAESERLAEDTRRTRNWNGDDFKVECPVGSGTLLTLQLSQR